MYDYSDDDRTKVISRIDDDDYRAQPLNLGFGYAVYDVLRMILEEMGNIEELLEGKEK